MQDVKEKETQTSRMWGKCRRDTGKFQFLVLVLICLWHPSDSSDLMALFSSKYLEFLSLSLVIKTVLSSIIPWSYLLAQESTDWLVAFSSYSETDLCSCCFPKEPEVIALQVHVGDEAGRGSALCLLLLQPSEPSLWLCRALLALLDSAGSSGLAHLSKLSGFSSPLGQSDFCSFGYSKLERN